MGFFDVLKKEAYINRLVKTYSHHYECDDMKSIDMLRKQCSAEQLKSILGEYKKLQKEGMDPFLINLFEIIR